MLIIEFIFFIFSFRKKYNNWWKCSVSGFITEVLKISFRTIENKTSKEGYHNNKQTKKGDIVGSDLYIPNKVTPNKSDKI